MVKTESLFDFKDYKSYLLFRENSWTERGFRSRLATQAGCQPPFVTQVLNGDKHFSLEQIDKINSFLNHTKDESHFYILLAEYDRAGTDSLRDHFQQRMNELREKHLNLQSRLQLKNELSIEDKTIYYSSWKYGAVHICTTVARFNSVPEIAKRLSLSENEVQDIADFLLQSGIIEKKGGVFTAGKQLMHLGRDTKLLESHHSQWRLVALRHFAHMQEQDVHYSAAVTMSKKDMEKIREILVGAIDQAANVIKPSSSEEVYVFNLDFFRL